MSTHDLPATPDALQIKKDRIISLDLARGMAMVFVVVVHVLEQLSSQSVKDSLFGGVVNIGTSMWAATMFMFLMGTGLVFSRSTTLGAGIRRGINLILLAFALNLLRGTLPTAVGLGMHQFTIEDLKPNSLFVVTFEIDILHFAGLALIVIALIRRISTKWIFLLGTGIAVLLLCPLLYGHKVDSPVLAYFTNYLWRTEEYGHFPIFPWLAYPLFGMVFGHFLKNSKNREVFFIQSAVLGLLLCLCGGYLAYNYSEFSMASWRSGDLNEGDVHPLWVVFETGVLLVSLSLYQYIATRIPYNKIFDWLCFWSKEVTLMYCLQWIVIGWIVIFITSYFGFVATLVSIPVVFVITHYLGIIIKISTRKL
jgi:uncharacterized membrane protein